jgi:hypothetical protein
MRQFGAHQYFYGAERLTVCMYVVSQQRLQRFGRNYRSQLVQIYLATIEPESLASAPILPFILKPAPASK